MAAVLTPGLTYRQRERLASALTRIGAVPVGSAASLFVDVDRAAVRALNGHPVHVETFMADVADAHGLPLAVVATCHGIAVGVRLGRTFVTPPPRRRKWISEEYARLTEHNRRDVQRYIRKLLKAQSPPMPKRSDPAVELAAARRWSREAGRLARRGER